MTEHLGLGVMINMLSDNSGSAESILKAIGKRIETLVLEKESPSILIVFDDKSSLKISDEGQSCCEHRYDQMLDFVGEIFKGVNLKKSPNIPLEYGDHEIMFLELQTDKGVLTFCTHNEHNGYYGGFAINAFYAP